METVKGEHAASFPVSIPQFVHLGQDKNMWNNFFFSTDPPVCLPILSITLAVLRRYCNSLYLFSSLCTILSVAVQNLHSITYCKQGSNKDRLIRTEGQLGSEWCLLFLWFITCYPQRVRFADMDPPATPPSTDTTPPPAPPTVETCDATTWTEEPQYSKWVHQ